MRSTRVQSLVAAVVLSSAPFVVANADDDDRGQRRIVSAAFGAGLNTALVPGDPNNHHVIPETIRVNVGDVVNFVVSGLHIIRVYDDGVSLRHLKDQIPNECEVNPLPPATFPPNCAANPPPAQFIPVPVIPEYGLAIYYRGINPLAIPPAPPPPFAAASPAVNRVEAVSFLKPGRYLVICALLPHFNDQMYAWVEVRGGGNGNGGNGNGHH